MFSRFRAFLGLSDTPKAEVQHAERALGTLERLEALRGTAAVAGYVVRVICKALLLTNGSSGADCAHDVNYSIKSNQLTALRGQLLSRIKP